MTDSRPVRARKEVGAPLKRLLKFRQEIMVKKKKKRDNGSLDQGGVCEMVREF